MTMAAVAPMPLISASSSSVSVTSEAAVGLSPLGPVLKTCPSIWASAAAPVAAPGVAPGVASCAVASLGETPTAGIAMAPATRTVNWRLLKLLPTVVTSTNTASAIVEEPNDSGWDTSFVPESYLQPPFQVDPAVSGRFLLRTRIGVQLDRDPSVV